MPYDPIDWSAYQASLAEQGMVGNQSLNNLPYYTGTHAFGTTPDLQGYGMSDLWRMYEGMEYLMSIQDLGDQEGAPWFQEMQPEAYDINKSGEGLLRKAYAEDYKGYQLGVGDLKQSAMGKLATGTSKVAQAGFAGGGSAAKDVASEQSKFVAGRRAMGEGWLASQAGYEKDVLGTREKYIQDLWSKYQIFTSGLTEEELPPQGGWEEWTEYYG